MPTTQFPFTVIIAVLLLLAICPKNTVVTDAATNTVIMQNNHLLRVLTFNTWLSGARVENGLRKIAKHIRLLQPDIVALQEIASPDVVRNLTAMLGASVWKAAMVPGASHPDTVILTRHKFVEGRPLIAYYYAPPAPSSAKISYRPTRRIPYPASEAERTLALYGIGASIALGERRVINFFSMHLDYTAYGPYAANNKQVTRAAQIMAGERNKGGWGRAQNIDQLLGDQQFRAFMRESEREPLIVAGDFNSPSHQDWTAETKHLHGDWTFVWPATKLLTDAGLVDAFRQLYPNASEVPGITWSTVWQMDGPEWDWTIAEPHDRIDFVFYKSGAIRPRAAMPYSGTAPVSPMPNPWKNDWPSDHYATVVDFAWTDGDDTVFKEDLFWCK